MTPIHDTHKLPYGNAVIHAFAYDTQTPIMFYNGDGDELAEVLYTNAAGFLFYGEGQQSDKGYFVNEKATIVATLKAGDVQWVAIGDIAEVNDGQVINAAGETVFSANTKKPWLPSWNDLHDRPNLGAWEENQYIVQVDKWGQCVTVDQWTTVLKIEDNPNCYKRGTNCGYRKAFRLAAPARAGQQLAVVNASTADVSIWGNEVTIRWTDKDQYTGAISALNPNEGVLLVSSHARDGYEWVAVTDTSLATSYCQTKTYEFKDWNAIGSIEVEDSTAIFVYSDCNGSATYSLRLKFNHDGHQVAVVNLTGGDLNLTNVVVTDVSQNVEATLGSGGSVMCVSGTITGSATRRFWALGGGSGGAMPMGTEQPLVLDPYLAGSIPFDPSVKVQDGQNGFGETVSQWQNTGLNDHGGRTYTVVLPFIVDVAIQPNTNTLKLVSNLGDDILKNLTFPNLPENDSVEKVILCVYLHGGTAGQTMFVRPLYRETRVEIVYGQYITRQNEGGTLTPWFIAYTAGRVPARCNLILNNGDRGAVEPTAFITDPLVWIKYY